MITESHELTRQGRAVLRLWRVCAGHEYTPNISHRHINFEISTVISGCGEYKSGEDSYPMEPGDVFVFSSSEPHCITAVGESGLELLNLQFEPGYLAGRSHDGFSREHASICFVHSPDFRNRIPAARAGYISERLYGIRRELMEQCAEYKLAIRSQTDEIMIALLRKHGYAGRESAAVRRSFPDISGALALIDSGFTERLTLAGLAREAGLSPNYFSALFGEIYGMTPWEYVVSKRVELAEKLICEEDGCNMLDIALKCGFNNTANFNRQFKRRTGVTPTEYRRYMRGAQLW